MDECPKTYWKEFCENYGEDNNEKVLEIKRSIRRSSVNSVLDVFDKYLPVNSSFHILEIGGLPGRYLIYMAKKFKYHVHSLIKKILIS